MSITLGVPDIRCGDVRVTYSVEVVGFPGLRTLWFSAPVEWASLMNARADAALVALLMPAMAIGAEIVVDGPVTDELAWSLAGETQAVLRGVRPEIARVSIEAPDAFPPSGGATAVATGYSAGIDSYATLARHHFAPDVPESLRITHLLYNNVGSHGHGVEGRALYRNRLELVRTSASSIGLPLIDIDSNVDDFHLVGRVGFQQSHTMRNAAVVHLLSAGIRHYLYASSVPYDRVAVNARVDVGYADPILLPLVSTRSVTLRSSGSDMDRAAKAALIAELPPTYERLDVCTESTDGTNCSECPKCQRTMLTLELIGVFDRYRTVFRAPRNRNWREEFLVGALTQGKPAGLKVVALYEARVGIPLRLRVRASARRIGGSVRGLAGRAARHAMRRVGRVTRVARH